MLIAFTLKVGKMYCAASYPFIENSTNVFISMFIKSAKSHYL